VQQEAKSRYTELGTARNVDDGSDGVTSPVLTV
jgi:hypothetical protein